MSQELGPNQRHHRKAFERLLDRMAIRDGEIDEATKNAAWKLFSQWIESGRSPSKSARHVMRSSNAWKA